MFDLKRRGSDRSVFDIKVPREHFESIRNRLCGTLMSYTDWSQTKPKPIFLVLGNIEILARTRPGKMVRMVTLNLYMYIFNKVTFSYVLKWRLIAC